MRKPLVVPYFLGGFEAHMIFFFALIMTLQFLFAIFIMLETKGKSLEFLAGEFVGVNPKRA